MPRLAIDYENLPPLTNGDAIALLEAYGLALCRKICFGEERVPTLTERVTTAALLRARERLTQKKVNTPVATPLDSTHLPDEEYEAVDRTSVLAEATAEAEPGDITEPEMTEEPSETSISPTPGSVAGPTPVSVGRRKATPVTTPAKRAKTPKTATPAISPKPTSQALATPTDPTPSAPASVATPLPSETTPRKKTKTPKSVQFATPVTAVAEEAEDTINEHEDMVEYQSGMSEELDQGLAPSPAAPLSASRISVISELESESESADESKEESEAEQESEIDSDSSDNIGGFEEPMGDDFDLDLGDGFESGLPGPGSGLESPKLSLSPAPMRTPASISCTIDEDEDTGLSEATAEAEPGDITEPEMTEEPSETSISPTPGSVAGPTPVSVGRRKATPVTTPAKRAKTPKTATPAITPVLKSRSRGDKSVGSTFHASELSDFSDTDEEGLDSPFDSQLSFDAADPEELSLAAATPAPPKGEDAMPPKARYTAAVPVRGTTTPTYRHHVGRYSRTSDIFPGMRDDDVVIHQDIALEDAIKRGLVIPPEAPPRPGLRRSKRIRVPRGVTDPDVPRFKPQYDGSGAMIGVTEMCVESHKVGELRDALHWHKVFMRPTKAQVDKFEGGVTPRSLEDCSIPMPLVKFSAPPNVGPEALTKKGRLPFFVAALRLPPGARFKGEHALSLTPKTVVHLLVLDEGKAGKDGNGLIFTYAGRSEAIGVNRSISGAGASVTNLGVKNALLQLTVINPSR
ncbi:hypothetical protein J8273_2049 [Carpediemonas membranifera]|uniref:Uncharacterized protein n=1 Tax=Carpediemonas membranifera TaxID=201153 RepID=A0A8J6B5W0_9EUKA|nr:hypothetical protein J8273_2049 [Carpediemonas membranifera]|eukprot:KAG9396318.1 hypothetical protein J8273_2049 [Carpediemonas membranifera]